MANYRPDDETCRIHDALIDDPDVSDLSIASVLVHEATHARLDHCGFGYDEAERDRIEKVCLRREMAFAKRVPGATLDGRVEETLAHERDYSDASLDEMAVADGRKQLAELGTPRWIIEAAVAFRRWRTRRLSRRR